MPYVFSDARFEDDLTRSFQDYGWNHDVRYLDTWIFNLLTLKNTIVNIHPLPTILACLFGAIASVVLIRILNNNRITLTHIIISLFLIVSPVTPAFIGWKNECFVMVLAMFASIMPYIFWQKIHKKTDKLYCFGVSLFVIICTLVTYFTYASATGVFVVIGLWMVAKPLIFNDKLKKAFVNLIKPVILYIASFIVGSGIYYLIVKVSPNVRSDLDNSVHLGPRHIFNILQANIWSAVKILFAYTGWQVLISVIILIFFITIFRYRQSTLKKNVNLVIGLIFILSSFALFPGAFELVSLDGFLPNNDRYALSIGVLIVILCGAIISEYKPLKMDMWTLTLVPVLLLLISYTTLSYAFVNAKNFEYQAVQEITQDVRSDIYRLHPDYKASEYGIVAEINPGFILLSPQARLFARQYERSLFNTLIGNLHFMDVMKEGRGESVTYADTCQTELISNQRYTIPENDSNPKTICVRFHEVNNR